MPPLNLPNQMVKPRPAFLRRLRAIAGAVPLTLKNLYGIIGIAAIALLWTVIVGVLGGLVVIALVVVLVIVLRARMRKRRPVSGPNDETK